MQGSIHGIVVDRDGTVCEGAHITLEEAGLAIRSANTDGNGRFDFDDVPGGAFQLSISSSGFATQVITGLLMMLGAVAWFIGGLAIGYIFFYPPILFILGIGTMIKGFLGKD